MDIAIVLKAPGFDAYAKTTQKDLFLQSHFPDVTMRQLYQSSFMEQLCGRSTVQKFLCTESICGQLMLLRSEL
jgi:hypothetical protein